MAAVCGKIISTQFVLGYVVQLKTRRLFMVINAGAKWDTKIPLQSHPDAIAELKFWENSFESLNKYFISIVYKPPVRGTSDASNSGVASKIWIDGIASHVYKNLSISESTNSSTWRELFAIHFSIQSIAPLIQHRMVEWHTDSFAATQIFKKGSNKPDLQLLSEQIFDLCHRFHIKPAIKWIPRSFLTEVDAMSRQIDYDDWETTSLLFSLLQMKWGPFTVDCFADNQNAKTTKFYSKYLCPSSSGVNAFLHSWAHENNYLVPPVYLVGRTIKHLRYYEGRGVLVVPYWVSAAFWVYLRNDSHNFCSFVKDYIVLENPRPYIRQGYNPNCFIGSTKFHSKLLALYLNFCSDAD